MPRFGPGSGGGGSSGDDGIPAGEYIIALKSFQRKKAKSSGKEYLRCRWIVCDGPLADKSFFSNMSLDVSIEGTASRWRVLMEACGVDSEFELGSYAERNADEGDNNIRELFLNRPFKATIKREVSGQYTNNDIQMIHYVRNWTDADKAAMDRWLDELENPGTAEPGTGAGPVDDWGGGGGGGSGPVEDYGPPGQGTRTGGFAAGDGDDEIPF